LAELVDTAYRLMTGAVRRYDGSVDKFVGDAVVAIFGAPVAHEDDPERAIRAAFDLRRDIQALGTRVDQPLNVRVGINVGEVIVKAFGSEARADYTAIGNAVNLASRLQGKAADGEILISDGAAHRVKGVFEVEAVSPFSVKGRKALLRAHRVLRELKAFSKVSLGERVELTEFIGREFEMETLASLLDKTLEGRGQVAVIRGETGVGKSRLVYEFYHRHAKERADWFTGRCTSYGSAVPHQPLAELLRRMAGIEEVDLADVRRRKLRAMVRGLSKHGRRRTADSASSREIQGALEIALGIDDPSNPLHRFEPPERRDLISRAIQWTLMSHARHRPVVYVFEDIHWADDLSLDFLDRLTLAAHQAPMLLLFITRPLVSHHLPEQAVVTQLTLEELSDEQSALLLRHLLHLEDLPPEIEEFMLQRTRGNPFFVEEMTLALRDRGVLEATAEGLRLARPLEEAEVPDTLEALILARLDHLEIKVRHVIQCASVIGQEFGVRVLENVTEVRERLQEAIGKLLTADFILEKSTLPELEYLFRNALTQEVTYHTLLRRRRALYHLKIAQVIEQIYHDRLDEHLELIAHHYFHGGAGEEARAHLKRAAEKCKFLDANIAAIDFTERLLEVLRKRLGGGRLHAAEIGEVLLDLGRLHYVTGDFAASERFYREAISHAQRWKLREHRLTALRNIGDVLRLLGRGGEGERSIRAALRACGPRDAPMRAKCHLNLGVLLMSLGRLSQAKRELEQFFRWSKRHASNVRDRYLASANLGLICQRLGDMDAAQVSLERACGLAEEMGRRRESAESLLNRALLDIDCGRLREARQRLARSLRTAEAIDHGRLSRLCRLALAEVAHHRGRLAEAAEINTALLTEAESDGHSYLQAVTRLNLAQIRLAQGHAEEAAKWIAEAERLAAEVRDDSLLPLIHGTAALTSLASGEIEQAAENAKRALTAARAVGDPREMTFALRVSGETHLASDDPVRACQQLAKAEEVARRAGLRREIALALARRAEAEVHRAGGDPERMISEAQGLADDLGDAVLIRHIRQLGSMRSI
jgi:tetratricopeptide (TPR) repeat protein